MKVHSLLHLLGRPSNDLKIELLLQKLGVKRRPFLTTGDYEAQKFNAWLPIRKAGIEFGFRNEAVLQSQEISLLGLRNAPLQLFTIIFYAGREDIRAYEGELPHQLTFEDSPNVVREKLAEYSSCFRGYIRDVWDFPTHLLTVSYNENRTKIADIVYTLKDKPTAEKKIDNIPSISEIALSLNHSVRDKVLFDTYQFLDFRDYLRKENTEEERYLPTEFGISLKIEGEGCHENPNYPDSNGSILTVVSLYRDRFHGLNKGWQGELPFEISFNDNPAVLKDKIPGRLLEWEDGDLQGYAKWQIDDYIIEIIFSTLMNYVAKVMISSCATKG